jgi:hypothetical protein
VPIEKLPLSVQFTKECIRGGGGTGNYRGISLLSVLGEIYSGILADRLRDWLTKNKIYQSF